MPILHPHAGDSIVPIDHVCNCGAKLRVKDELAGRKVKCPKCTMTTTIPFAQATEEIISVRCECGKSYQAKASTGGKTFTCSSCHQLVPIPKSNPTASLDLAPFGSTQTSTGFDDLLDTNLPALGLPTGNHVPYHAPPPPSPSVKSRSSEKASKPREPPPSDQATLDLNQEPLYVITAILCILFGLGRIATLGSFGILLNPSVLLSLGGLIYLVSVLICLGILAAGIGLLLKQDWAANVGQIAALLYFVLAMIQLVLFFANLSMLAGNSATAASIGGIVVRRFSFLIGESVAPALLLYVTFRDNK